MRFLKRKPSGRDQNIPVFEFSFGKEELKLLHGLAVKAQMNLPELFELMPLKGRLQNIIKIMGQVLDDYKNGKP